MTIIYDIVSREISDIVKPWGPAGIRCILLWGSILDVMSGSSGHDPRRDIDVLVICQNVEKAQVGDAGMHGRRSMCVKADDRNYDLSLVDFGYVAEAVSEGRWTVVRAVREGRAILDDGCLHELRTLVQPIHPFENSDWKDWFRQSRNLLSKAAVLIDDGLYEFAQILLRDALTTYAYSLVARFEGQPPTPSNFPALLQRQMHRSPALQGYMQFQGVAGISRDDVQGHWIHVSEILAGGAGT